jgi:hypothetical protein
MSKPSKRRRYIAIGPAFSEKLDAILEALAGVEEAGEELSRAIGNPAVARIARDISNRIERLTAATPPAEVRDICAAADHLSAVLGQIRATYSNAAAV